MLYENLYKCLHSNKIKLFNIELKNMDFAYNAEKYLRKNVINKQYVNNK